MHLPSGSFLINIGLSEVWKKNKEKTTLSSLLVQIMPGVRVQQHTLIHVLVSLNPSMVHSLWFFCKTLYQKRKGYMVKSNHNIHRITSIFVWPWKVVSVSVCYLFYQPMDGRSKHGLFVFPPKKTLIWRRRCSIGQSCCSMTSNRSFDWFLESSRTWSLFTRAFA